MKYPGKEVKSMNLIIIDDDPLVAAALTTILEAQGAIHVCATGTDGQDALRLYQKHRPDVLLMDIRMKDMDGLAAASRVLSSDPKACILLLTTFTDDEYIIQALKIGVKGYILKQDYQAILPAIEAVCTGQTVFGREVTSRIPGLLQKQSDFSYENCRITRKEYEIITLVAEGLNNREIAEKICLSEGTVRNYISTILDKLELRDRTQLAVFYYRH